MQCHQSLHQHIIFITSPSSHIITMHYHICFTSPNTHTTTLPPPPLSHHHNHYHPHHFTSFLTHTTCTTFTNSPSSIVTSSQPLPPSPPSPLSHHHNHYHLHHFTLSTFKVPSYQVHQYVTLRDAMEAMGFEYGLYDEKCYYFICRVSACMINEGTYTPSQPFLAPPTHFWCPSYLPAPSTHFWCPSYPLPAPSTHFLHPQYLGPFACI